MSVRTTAQTSNHQWEGLVEGNDTTMDNEDAKALMIRNGAIRSLSNSGYTPGLIDLLTSHSKFFASRIWILDNSGSMAIGDGYRIVETSDRRVEGQKVSRWEELKQMVVDRAEVAACLSLFTEFRFLNYPGDSVGCQSFAVGKEDSNAQQEIMETRNIMLRANPIGTSNLQVPLTMVVQKIRQMQHYLTAANQRVTVVIVTDGLPTDEYGSESNLQPGDEFLKTLRSLENLPVWLVIRLCTNDKHVVDYWNSLDTTIELQLEVLDDHLSEAKEISRHNKWLNYALPLHRCREMGCNHRVLDLIDERKLTLSELREFCMIILGDKAGHLPDPKVSWKSFSAALETEIKNYRLQWDPLKKKMKPWIDIREMNKSYGRHGFLRRSV